MTFVPSGGIGWHLERRQNDAPNQMTRQALLLFSADPPLISAGWGRTAGKRIALRDVYNNIWPSRPPLRLKVSGTAAHLLVGVLRRSERRLSRPYRDGR